MAGNNKKYGLGRGLDALFGDENDVIKWVLCNEKIVLDCPYNKISNNLIGLRDMLEKILRPSVTR